MAGNGEGPQKLQVEMSRANTTAASAQAQLLPLYILMSTTRNSRDDQRLNRSQVRRLRNTPSCLFPPAGATADAAFSPGAAEKEGESRGRRN